MRSDTGVKFGTFCSGICAPEVAWRDLGWHPQFFSEIEPFPIAVQQHRFRGKPAADGLRYKAIGNSMCVDVMRWIGRRIQMVRDLTGGEQCA